jgi:hypothetical protein
MRIRTKFLGIFFALASIPFATNAQSSPQPKCDGTIDDTAALQSAIDDSVARHQKLTLPSGTCIISTPTVTLPDNLILQGAGKTCTTIRRKNRTNSKSAMFMVAGKTGSVTITDLTIDYNKSHQDIGGETIGTSAATITNFSLQRARIVNSALRAVSFLYTNKTFLSNIVISDDEFANNGSAKNQNEDGFEGDVFIAPANGLRLQNNHAENTAGSFFLTGTGGNSTGMGDMTITGNVLTGVLGFGIALGGGGPDPAGGTKVTIRSNQFDMPRSRQNVIDVAFWDHVIIDRNTIISGTCESECAAIGDAPPASDITVTNNTITGNPELPSNNCISLGGSREIITGNTCFDSGGSGIVLIGASGGVSGSLIVNNTVKNCNEAAKGNHAGIDLYLPDGASMSGVTIRGNKVFDDQGHNGTQTWGIGLEVNGRNTSGFSGITIESNDVRNNKIAGIMSNARGSENVVVRDNVGDH